MAVTAKFVEKGDNIDYTAASDLAYMEVVPLASRVGVALEPIAAGSVGTVTLTGAFEMPAATGAIAVGAEVFWSTATNNIVAATGEKTVHAGWAIAAKAEAGTTVLVRID